MISEYPEQFNSFYEHGETINNKTNMIFVFGSNLAGRHGAGAARVAYQLFGAKMFYGVGLYNKSYAIPTKDENIKTLPLDRIKPFVDDFIKKTTEVGEYRYFVTAVGCGLAGYEARDIAPMFRGSQYCWFPKSWEMYI